MPVRAVLFDADGVVQQNPPGWEASLREHGDGFVDDLFASEAPAMVGEREFADVLEEVLRRWRIPVPAAELIGHWRDIEVSKGTLDVVGELRAAGIGCWLASNQHAYRAAHMRESLGYDEAFDGQFYSCDLGATKSSPEFFSSVLERLGLPGREVLLVDDASGYGEVARSVGLRSVCWSIGDGTPALHRLLSSHGLPLR